MPRGLNVRAFESGPGFVCLFLTSPICDTGAITRPLIKLVKLATLDATIRMITGLSEDFRMGACTRHCRQPLQNMMG